MNPNTKCPDIKIKVYQLDSGMWRGFVWPYGITTEMESSRETLIALHEMILVYEAMLDEHNWPQHLVYRPLHNPEDIKHFNY